MVVGRASEMLLLGVVVVVVIVETWHVMVVMVMRIRILTRYQMFLDPG